MKILVVTKSFSKGGSASGASNLSHALRVSGADVVQCDANQSVSGRPIGLLRTAERVYERLLHDAETHCLRLGPPSLDLVSLQAQHRPDIIQLCDISANSIGFSGIATVDCPVVHRMSDFWPYHGARHYADSPPKPLNVADWLLRQTVFTGEPTPDARVAPSHWLADRLRAGGATDPIRVIRNAVVIPPDPSTHKRPNAKINLGFVAGAVDDPRKGFSHVPPFLRALPGGAVVHLFGHPPRQPLPEIPTIEWRIHGRFGRGKQGQVYKEIDILLCPSEMDNSPNVVTEALSFGVPVIAQSGTGMDSYVFPETGALVDFRVANEHAISSFVEAVDRIKSGHEGFSAAARDFVREELAPEVIGATYLSLYRDLLEKV